MISAINNYLTYSVERRGDGEDSRRNVIQVCGVEIMQLSLKRVKTRVMQVLANIQQTIRRIRIELLHCKCAAVESPLRIARLHECLTRVVRKIESVVPFLKLQSDISAADFAQLIKLNITSHFIHITLT